MTLRTRALLAALIVVVVAASGAFFIAQRSAVVARQQAFDVATTGDVRDLFDPMEAASPQLASVALRKLEDS